MLYRIKKIVKSQIKDATSDPMKRNSLFLIAGQLLNAGSGLFFWILCARLFTAHDVGLATAFVSYGALIATFTTFGLPITIIRFLPQVKEKAGFFGAAFSIMIASSVLGGIVAVVLIHAVAPRLDFVQQSPYLIVVLVLLVLGNALSSLFDNMLMAYRRGKYLLIKHSINSLPRIVLPFLVVGMAIDGIVVYLQLCSYVVSPTAT